jgi:hypothetical protein
LQLFQNLTAVKIAAALRFDFPKFAAASWFAAGLKFDFRSWFAAATSKFDGPGNLTRGVAP